LAEANTEAEIDRLYGLPLDEFVGQRDALAKRLRADGERERATAVKALRKPTAGAWALNQAVRRRRAETGSLLAAGDRLRAAHAALLSGGGRKDLRAAMDEQRTLAALLADCAEAIASETGKSGPALKERVRSTLHAAALDDDVRDELAGGRLVREREAVGLGAGFGASGAAPVPEPARSGEREKKEKKAETLLVEARTALEEAESALEAAESEHEDASARVEAARAALSEAQSAERDAVKQLRLRQRERTKRERELRRLED
jgi:hypothetical protein